MKQRLLFILSVTLAAVVSCKKIDPNQDPAPAPMPQKQLFTATLPSSLTKTTVDNDGYVYWQETDAIGIIDATSGTPVKANLKSRSNGNKTAIFEPVSTVTTPVGAIYPYDETAVVTGSGSKVSVNIGASQDGSFAKANIAAAKNDNFNLSFKNVAAIFKFTVSDENAKSVKLTATAAAGTLDINIGESISSSLSATGTGNEIKVADITPGADGYMAIAPSEYSSFSFAWFDEDGAQIGGFTLDKTIDVAAGELYEWGDLEENDGGPFVDFEDAIFEAQCVANFDLNEDGKISYEEASGPIFMNVDIRNVTSLKGIEYFTNLESLFCNLSNATWDSTTGIYFDNTTKETVEQTLAYLDVSHNTRLATLMCYGADLETLDLSNNTALTTLNFEHSNLSNLKLGDITSLTYLSCNFNNLSSLDVSKNAGLLGLQCSNNNISNLDLSNNTALQDLCCSNNKLTSTSLILPETISLGAIDCSGNLLTSLDVSYYSNLSRLICNNNSLSGLDVSNNTNLTDLDCTACGLGTLNVSNNELLKMLSCSNNGLTTLDVSNNAVLESLNCYGNLLTSVDVSHNPNLKFLSFIDNDLESLDVSNNTSLEVLYCSENALSSLTLGTNSNLWDLDCHDNQLTGSLDVSGVPNLRFLFTYDNNLDIIYVWPGFTAFEIAQKDDDTQYVVIGTQSGSTDRYTIKSPWN